MIPSFYCHFQWHASCELYFCLHYQTPSLPSLLFIHVNVIAVSQVLYFNTASSNTANLRRLQ